MSSKFKVYLSVISLLLLVTNCSRPTPKSTPDYDRLYALMTSPQYKDSLTEVLKPEYEKAINLSNTKPNRDYIEQVISRLRWSSDSISLRKLSKRAILFGEKVDDEYYLAQIYNHLGAYHHNNNQRDSVYYYYLKAENIYKQLHDTIKLGESEFYIARLLYEMGMLKEAEAKVVSALLHLKKDKNNPIHFEANPLLSFCIADIRKDYYTAEKYQKRAIDLMTADLNKNKVLSNERLLVGLSLAYANLAELKINQENYLEAIKYAKEGEKCLTPESHTFLVTFLSNHKNLALYKLSNNQKYIDNIIDNYNKEVKINALYRMFGTSMQIAELYNYANNKDEAIKWARNAHSVAKYNNLPIQQHEALQFILTNEDYFLKEEVQELIQLGNLINTQENETRSKFSQISYETELVIAENKTLKESIYLRNIILIGIVIIICSISYIIHLHFKDKEQIFQKKQQKADDHIYQLMLEKDLIAVSSKADERNRIARGLHDGVVNGLFTIRFNLQQLHTNNQGLQNLLIEELKKLEQSTREISHALQNNHIFEETRFATLLEGYISLQKNEWNTLFSLAVEEGIDLEDLTPLQKINTYYIIREAIHNVNKYAKASECTIEIKADNNYITIAVIDNGIGFDKDTKRGIGLINMRERAKLLHSELIIDTQKGRGSIISFTIKIKHQDN
ncbi:ATP-binding protein [Myroides injenensis]|uniref:ATP-binding protein n=1 Tax=Myroides injenensis TaxID=1183151 RepID=UPI000289ADC1|nr:ATP-binding protein [Myroides injenensis]